MFSQPAPLRLLQRQYARDHRRVRGGGRGRDGRHQLLGRRPAGDPARDPMVRVVNNVVNAGVVPVISAGNDRELFGLGTVGSPSTAPDAISVAATANSHVFTRATLTAPRRCRPHAVRARAGSDPAGLGQRRPAGDRHGRDQRHRRSPCRPAALRNDARRRGRSPARRPGLARRLVDGRRGATPRRRERSVCCWPRTAAVTRRPFPSASAFPAARSPTWTERGSPRPSRARAAAVASASPPTSTARWRRAGPACRPASPRPASRPSTTS